MLVESTLLRGDPKAFLFSGIEQRHPFLMGAYESMRGKAQAVAPPFSILVGGSTVYGYNGHKDARLDDIDGSIIAQRKQFSFNQLNESLLAICETDSLTDPARIARHVDAFRAGEIDLIRVPGLYQGVIPFSFHVFPLDIFRTGFYPTSIDRSHTIIAPNKPKYVSAENPYTLQGQVVPSPIVYRVIDKDEIAIEQHFSRRSPKGDIIVDFIADELLTSKIVWEQPGQGVEATLKAHKRTFIRSALFYAPGASNDDIINILSRHERFSTEFRQELSELIERERATLQSRNKR